jgi:antitoxin (DNA-binding transcriptional repressor) of toxin-antitoxin stability system
MFQSSWLARSGENVVVTSGKSRTPVARIEAIPSPDSASSGKPTKRTLGVFAGKITIRPEFFESLPEEELNPWEGTANKEIPAAPAPGGKGE